jgi:hypothetical protein
MIFAPVLHGAWLATGDAKYLDEIEGWYKCCGLDVRMQAPSGKFRGGMKHNKLISASLMMEIDPEHHELWRSIMLANYRIIRTGLLPDGTSYRQWECDSDTGAVTPTPTHHGIPACRTGRSAVSAKGCVDIRRWLPEEGAAATARAILATLDVDTFRYLLPPTPGERVPESWRIESELLDVDSLVGWLWAYWKGRYLRYW